MEGRTQDNLEWWMLTDSGLLSVNENQNRVQSGLVHLTPAAGDYTRSLSAALPQNQSALFRNRISPMENSGFQNPNSGNSGRVQVNPDPDFPTLYDLETLFGRMSLSSNQSGVYGSSNLAANSGTSYGNLNRMQVYGRGYDRNVSMNKGFEGFGDLNINDSRNNIRTRNEFRVRSDNRLAAHSHSPNIHALIQERRTFPSLEELRGKEQQRFRLLQQKLDEGKPEEIERIFWEVKNRVCELMVDQSGNYLIQKLFQVCNQQQMTQLLASVIRDECQLVAICLDMHGTRAVQTMLRHLTTVEQRALVVAALRHITLTLTKSVNGYHVVQHVVKFFSNEEKKQILNVVADNSLDIATDRSGCCVLQHCVENADAQSRERLVAEITANALVLSEHPYGNYVVQNILGLRIPRYTSEILKRLAGSFVPLSMNKYGSNVVEKCLKESDESQTRSIIQEIVSSPNFLMVLQDPFGNYVVQSALDVSQGHLRYALVSIINVHYVSLHSHPHGKRVLAKARGHRQRVV